MVVVTKIKRIFVKSLKNTDKTLFMKVYHLDLNGQHYFYSSLTALCNDQNLHVSKFTLDRYNFNTPYIGKNFTIYKGILKSTGDVGKVKKMDLPKKVAEQERKGLIKSDDKINIQNDTYIYRNEKYYIKINDTLYICNQDFEIDGQRYKLPTNKIGNIENLKIT